MKKTSIEFNVAAGKSGVIQFSILSNEDVWFDKSDAKKIKAATVKALRAAGFAVNVTGNIEIK